MTKTILEEYLPYSSLARTDELVSENSELMQKMHILEKKLKIATKALKDVSLSLWDEMECRSCAKKAIKEMEKAE